MENWTVSYKKTNKMSGNSRSNAIFYILPTFLVYIVFLVYPLLSSFWISFSQWDGISPDIRFVGIINYVRLFADRIFLISLKNTIFFTIGGVVFITLSGLIMALLIQQIAKGKIILRVAYFVPVVISEITFGLLWKWMLMPDFGLWNGLLKGIGMGKHFYPLLGSPNTALVTLLGVFVMKWAGLTMVIYLANIQSISEEIYEAAVVEGAGTLQVLFFITLPLLRTATLINLLLTFVWSFRVFDLIYVMTLGAPGYSTYVITLHMYNLAFKFFRMGYACSLSFFIFVIMIAISIIYIKVTKTER